MRHQQRIARVIDQGREPVDDADLGLDGAEQQAPPSEVMRPPSKAAVTFLRRTDGNKNGSGVFSTMAGVAPSDSADIGLDTQISASNQTITLRPPSAIPSFFLP